MIKQGADGKLVEIPDDVEVRGEGKDAKRVLTVRGMEFSEGSTILIPVKINSLGDRGNFQLQVGSEHFTPSLADLSEAVNGLSSSVVEQLAGLTRKAERQEERYREQVAKDAAIARGEDPGKAPQA